MSKVRKWLALILALFILTVLGVVLFVRLYFTSDRIAAWIKPPLEHYLHRQVSLSEAKLSLRGFRAEGLDIRKEGAGFALLKSERLELRCKLKQLMKGKIEIHSLAFGKPEITLIRQEDGSLNIDDLLPQKRPSELAISHGEKAKSESGGIALLVSLLTAEDGRAILIDRTRQPQKTLEITSIQSHVSDLSATAPMPFTLEGQMAHGGQGSLAIAGTIDLANNAFQGDINLQKIHLPSISPFMGMDESFSVREGSLTLAAAVGLKEFDRLRAQGSLNLEGLAVEKNSEPFKTLEIEAGFKMQLVGSQRTLEIDTLDLVLNGQKAKINGAFRNWGQRPQLEFRLASPQLKLDELLSLLPKNQPSPSTAETAPEQPTTKDTSLESVAPESSSDSAAPPTSTTKPMPQSEEKEESAQAASTSETAAHQSAEEPAEGTPRVSGEPGEPTQQASEKPIEAVATAHEQKGKFKPLDANGEIHLDWFFYNKLVASNVDFRLKLRDGELQVEPLSGTLYGGGVEGSLKSELGVSGPPFQYSITAKDVLLDEIVGAFWPAQAELWAGNISLISEATGIGADLTSLESRTDLNITQAVFTGHPLLLELSELFQAEDLQRWHFSEISAKIFTSQGLATVDDFQMLGPNAQAKGSGTAHLIDKTLDFRLLLQIRAQYAGKLAVLRDIVPKITDERGFVEMPLTVGGTFANPEYKVDQRWLGEKAEELLGKPLKESQQEVAPELPLTEDGNEQLQEDIKQLVQ